MDHSRESAFDEDSSSPHASHHSSATTNARAPRLTLGWSWSSEGGSRNAGRAGAGSEAAWRGDTWRRPDVGAEARPSVRAGPSTRNGMGYGYCRGFERLTYATVVRGYYRYKHLIGKTLVHPIVKRKLPVIADEYVDINLGTGAVKITPAHDPNDYEIGKRHNLPFINILDDEGKMLDNCGQFSGMKRFDVRRSIIKCLEQLKLYRETKDHAMVVPQCSRSKDVVEPMLKPQWYIRCDTMAAEAIKVVKNGELKIIPDVHEKIWYHWMENIRDWCISRQLWWGHRIPAYRVTVPAQVKWSLCP
ncbi:hypothetical protein evm_009762 [Chilo suppressalis]|nr:hypothetical protein evm_009762 [Chilo suppressalis]